MSPAKRKKAGRLSAELASGSWISGKDPQALGLSLRPSPLTAGSQKKEDRLADPARPEDWEEGDPFGATTPSSGTLRPGNCSVKNICGLEAGCKQRGEMYECICPSHGLPTREGRCPRITVPANPKPFAVAVLNVTTASLPTTLPPHPQPHPTNGSVWAAASGFLVAHSLLIVLGAVLITSLCLYLITCVYLKYRKKVRLSIARKGSALPMSTPMSLTKGVIDADRFTRNPSYIGSDPTPTAFPVISHDCILFQNAHCIGEGCFGKVFKGEFRRPNGTVETVAIKVLKDSASKEAEDDFMREVEIMSSFQHENILSLLGVALKEIGKNPCMVFEFMPHGDLTEVLRSNSRHFWKAGSTAPRLNQESLLSIARQIACGMKYLAGQHFVHRDLACRNCLLGNNLTVKIADFGMSRDVYTCDYYKIGGKRLLPMRWMSPESVIYGRFTLESDVWSFGVVLWEIYTLGKQPYFGHTNEQVKDFITKGIKLIPPDDCPELVCELMQSCWQVEPKNRPTFKVLYEKLKTATPQLPRPPPFPVTTPTLPDIEEYLSPNPRPAHDYLQPLPD